MISPEQTERVKNWLGSGSINFFGRPYAGKDDQADRFALALGGSKFSSGELIREARKRNPNIMPKEVQEHMDAGGIIPSEEFVKIVVPYLTDTDFRDQPLMLSSVGRYHGEEPMVLEALSSSNHPLKAVIALNIDEATSVARWENRHSSDRGSQKRADDAAASALETRFKEYREKTVEVLQYYRESGHLIEIDAAPSREQVFNDIMEALALRATSEQ